MSSEITIHDITFDLHNYSGELTGHDREVLLRLARQLADARRDDDDDEAPE